MVDTLFTDMLKTFDEDEMRSFGKFIRSPYFNESLVMVKLFESIKKYYPGFTNRNFTKQKLFRKLYPQKKYNDDTMRKHLSDMQKLGEEFLAHFYLDKNPFTKKLYVVEKLDNKNLTGLFARRLRELEAEYIHTESLSEEYFERSFSISTKKWNNLIGGGEAGQYSKHNDVIDTHLQRLGYFLTAALLNLLKMNQDTISIARFYSLDDSKAVTTQLMQHLNIKALLENYKQLLPDFYPIVMIYYYNYIILSGTEDDNDENYFSLKALIVENSASFTLHERKIHYLYLENGCLAKIRKGRSDFKNELHEIYNAMLKDKLYVYRESDHMTTSRFIKIAQNALDIKQYKWTEDFINAYSAELPDEVKKDVRNYSLAQLNFSKGNFDKAIEYASLVKLLTFNINFQSKILKLKACYEMKYFDEILYQLNSYTKTLNADIVSPEQAKNNFIAFMRMLGKIVRYSIKDEKSGQKIVTLTRELQTIQNIYEKQWLIDKFEMLKLKS